MIIPSIFLSQSHLNSINHFGLFNFIFYDCIYSCFKHFRRKIDILINEKFTSNNYAIKLCSEKHPSGVYFIPL